MLGRLGSDRPEPSSRYGRRAWAGIVTAICLLSITCGRAPSTSGQVASNTPSPSSTESSSGCVSGSHPPGRVGAALVYDAARSQLLLFGGDQSIPPSSGSSNDTWTGSGRCWTQLHPAASPSNRGYAAVAFDHLHNVVVLYGGLQSVAGKAPVPLFDTWLWDGSNWAAVRSSTSPALIQPVGAFDIATGQFVVFGRAQNEDVPETWTWNGQQWLQLKPLKSPTTRTSSSLAYDYRSRKLVLFGGFNNGIGNLNDTWSWDGTTWTQERPSVVPTGGNGSVLCTGTVLVRVGPPPATTGTWVWQNGDWTQVPTPHPPPARWDASCAFTGVETVVITTSRSGDQWTFEAWSFRNFDWSANG